MLFQCCKHLSRITSSSITRDSLSCLERSFSTLRLSLPKTSLLSSPPKLPVTFAIQTRLLSDTEELAKDGYGIKLYDEKTGRRGTLRAVEQRFKRLDWGAWITPKQGRNKKWWKKSHEQLVNIEKHTFSQPYHKRRYDRAVNADFKAQRHIVDDPYKVYNNMSFQLYHSIKLKNMERIKKYGSNINNFHTFKAHSSKTAHYIDKEKNPFYEPPGYHADVAEGGGVYSPDVTIPQNIMAPEYKLERRHYSKRAINNEKRYWKNIAKCQPYYGEISLCSKLRLPVAETRLG